MNQKSMIAERKVFFTNLFGALSRAGEDTYFKILDLIQTELLKVDDIELAYFNTLLPFTGSQEDIEEWETKRSAILNDCSDANVPEAQYEVATKLIENREYERAFELYLKSAESGYPPSLYSVGWAFFHGLGVDMDKQQGFHFIKLSAGQLYDLALEFLIAYHSDVLSDDVEKVDVYKKMLSWVVD